MGTYDEFRFRAAACLPSGTLEPEELERIRTIRREDMEYTNENGFSVRVVMDPTLCLVQDVFYRILMSDRNDTRLTMIFPNQWPAAYSAIAEMLNKYNVSCRNVHAFAMDELGGRERQRSAADLRGRPGLFFPDAFLRQNSQGSAPRRGALARVHQRKQG